MKLKEKFLTSYRSDRVLLGEWILTLVTALFLFVSIAYVDMRSLTVWSTNVWDVTFDSNIRHLYEYTAQNVYGLKHSYMGSELLSVLPWSVWNFPIWLIQRLTGKSIADSAVMLAYSKLFLVALSLVMLRYTKKIAALVTGDALKTTWAVFLSASSTFLFLGVLYAGQNDIIMVTASVIAVYHLLKGKQRQFLVWSAVAIAVKPFFLLAFLAVLLLYEKKLTKVFVKLMLSVLGLVVQKLLFWGAPLYAESISEGPSKEMLKKMFSGNLSTSFGAVSFLAVSLVLIYIYAYSRRFSKEDVLNQNVLFAKYAVYLIAVTNMAYLMFSPFSFYRVVTLVPFLYIVIVQNEKMFFYNNILETAMSLGLVLKLALRNSTSLFRSKAINGALIQRFFGYSVDPDHESAYTSLMTYLKDNESVVLFFQPLFAGVAFIGGILLLAWNHPEKQLGQPLYNGGKNCRVLLWARTVLLVPFVLAVIYLFIKAPIRLY